ncbi:Restriction endonuclease [Gimesia chilikensis]|uniref:Restriction endonuclease n=1 Tax=Gimesia chilikensis TaxID=2605989 RepID=A0A517WKF4_9PLAN|nr:restriction endonuclease [Gimesia chilikensis]QDU05709.1 Restriction endonuclease [Gimesia chilikensis]
MSADFSEMDENDQEKARRWSEMGSECVQGPHSLSASDRETAKRLADELLTQNRLRGAWCSKSKIVTVQILNPDLVHLWKSGEIACFPYSWSGGTFGGSLTLTLLSKRAQTKCRASIFHGDPMLKVVRDEPFVVVVVNGKQIVRADLVDYSTSDDSKTLINSFVNSIAGEGASGWIDADANFWETLFHQSIFHKYLTPSEELSLGWYERVRNAYIVRQTLTILKEDGLSDVCRRLSLRDDAKGFISAIEDCNGDFRVVRAYLLEIFEGKPAGTFLKFMQQFNDLPDDEESGFVRSGCYAIMAAYYLCATVSRCGKTLPWINVEGSLVFLEVEAHKFPEFISPREYWIRQVVVPYFGWGHLLGGGDVPVSKSDLEEMIDDLPTCENADECLIQADFLLAEAGANKQSCIPLNAVVQLAIGPFAYMELREIGPNVLVALRQANGLVYYFNVEPDKAYWSANLPHDDDDVEAVLKVEKALASLKLLVAAVIRDFWVVEHREAVFEQRRAESLLCDRKVSEGPRVVYLPRVKYDYKANPDIDTCANELDTNMRRSHFVQGHLRKSRNPATNQLALAERYGFSVPEGYTFVRPHERGKEKRDIIYRSRSALRSLYTASPLQSSHSQVRWFQFELDVQTLMQRLGFAVEHVAASRRGDNGVDVYATKGVDLEAVHWIIQCKCWNPKRKVSPSVVRELAGTLTRYPSGTRGMIVTTSGFTAGAVQEANDHEIRLMDGEEFSQRVLSNQEKIEEDS